MGGGHSDGVLCPACKQPALFCPLALSLRMAESDQVPTTQQAFDFNDELPF